MRTSLEQERRTLLAQIEASRQVYRQVLSGDMATAHKRENRIRRPGLSSDRQIGQWMSDHPLYIAAGIALLVWLTPGLMRRIRSRRARHTQSSASSPHTGTVKAIATVLILLIRDPRRLEHTASVLNAAWRWLRHRAFPSTSILTPTTGRKPHA